MSEAGSPRDYEKLASFYLGREYDLAGKRLLDTKLLYDAKDLTTHAMCVGMTGSGKTGLCLSLLEEAAIDGIPAICVDPKGDLGNLLLAFPELAPADFQAWIDSSEATRRGMRPEEFAEETAKKWQAGLEDWDQDRDRIKKFRDAVDICIFTPGSNAGIPLTVLKSFAAPAPEIQQDSEFLRERIAGAASGLLTLLGMDADPLTSREHILLCNIFETKWRDGHDLDLPELIRCIQSPPLEKIGVFDLESFFPASERMKLAMSLNNLLASPAFAGWLEGQALDIGHLLYTAQGKPRLSIISIAHLSDSERMFFVTILLNELVSWMRTQPGTSSLRGLFYMDEIFGYFPPTAKPPSKPPMLTLLKQARAFGLGICLATQNPVDLDYKGLANIGTWFLGRLQTQRDKERVLEGLEGAAAQTGSQFNRGKMEQTLAALGNRVFLMNNVHDDAPVIFQTRWAMSYLCGPLSRQQIKRLMDPRRHEFSESQVGTPIHQPHHLGTSPATAAAGTTQQNSTRPIVPNDVNERFWQPSKRPLDSANVRYVPALLATASCHYVRVSAQLDTWLDKSFLVIAEEEEFPTPDLWAAAQELPPHSLQLAAEPEDGFQFEQIPAALLNDKQYRSWEKELRDHLYRRVPVRVYYCPQLKATSPAGVSELDARLGWQQQLRELRDAEIDKLRDKFRSKKEALESKIRTAEQRVSREQSQYDQQKWSAALNFGQSIVGALLGRKSGSRSSSATRSLGRAAQERSDLSRANESLEDLLRDRQALENECLRDIDELKQQYDLANVTLEPKEYPCRKGDIRIELLCLLWIPFQAFSGDDKRSALVPLPEPGASPSAA